MDEFISISGDFLLERKRLAQALRRLEDIIIMPSVAQQLGKDILIELQSEIDRLSTGIYRLESLAKSLSSRLQVDKYVQSALFLKELSEYSKQSALRLGKKIRVTIGGADIKSDRNRMALVKDALVQMIDVLIEFGVESEKERQLRGKKTESILQIVLKRKDEDIQLTILADGNGIMPPLSREIGEQLARYGCRMEFSGRPGKWSCWIVNIPHYGPMMQCYRLLINNNLLFIPATSVVAEKVNIDDLPRAQERLKIVCLNESLECVHYKLENLKYKNGVFICVHSGNEKAYLLVDQSPIREEIFVKPVSENLTGYGRYVGVAVESHGATQSLRPVLNPSFIVYEGML